MPMNPEWKAKWLTALRSGEYKQCQGRLRHTDFNGEHSYCCLGVLGHLMNPKGWRKELARVAKSHGLNTSVLEK